MESFAKIFDWIYKLNDTGMFFWKSWVIINWIFFCVLLLYPLFKKGDDVSRRYFSFIPCQGLLFLAVSGGIKSVYEFVYEEGILSRLMYICCAAMAVYASFLMLNALWIIIKRYYKVKIKLK